MKKKSQFPSKTENQLRFILNINTSKLIKRYKEKVENKDVDIEIIDFTKEEKRQIIKDLTSLAIANNKHIFDSWRKLSDEELKMPDLKGSKYWIRENYLRIEKLNKTFSEKIKVIRDDKYREILSAFNNPLNFRFDKLKNGRISNSDINKLLTELKSKYNPSAEIKELISKLEKTKNLRSDEISKLKSWANRRNELWARNETGNLYASQLKNLWFENEIDKYRWMTMQDERVRIEHIEKDGKIFNVEDDILPGQEFGCRCWAEPIKIKEE